MSEVKHDYKNALDWLLFHIDECEPKLNKEQMDLDNLQFTDSVRDAIIHALKLADKVTGEPSDDMIMAAVNSFNENGNLAVVTHAKAYIAQAEKEIG